MPDMTNFLMWLSDTSFSTTIRESQWLFPFIEVCHIFGFVTLVGVTSALDLRLLGFWLLEKPVSLLAEGLLNWTWAGFAVMVVTGGLLFISDPPRFYYNTAFRFKMLGVLLAGTNALVFHNTAYRSVSKWDNSANTPFGAKLAGVCSILFWFGIAAAGRWIAFV
jgi:hypothetical protein